MPSKFSEKAQRTELTGLLRRYLKAVDEFVSAADRMRTPPLTKAYAEERQRMRKVGFLFEVVERSPNGYRGIAAAVLYCDLDAGATVLLRVAILHLAAVHRSQSAEQAAAEAATALQAISSLSDPMRRVSVNVLVHLLRVPMAEPYHSDTFNALIHLERIAPELKRITGYVTSCKSHRTLKEDDVRATAMCCILEYVRTVPVQAWTDHSRVLPRVVHWGTLWRMRDLFDRALVQRPGRDPVRDDLLPLEGITDPPDTRPGQEVQILYNETTRAALSVATRDEGAALEARLDGAPLSGSQRVLLSRLLKKVKTKLGEAGPS